MALSPAPPAVGMRQGTPARVPLNPVAHVIVPPTALLIRRTARGPNWIPIPFISVIDVVGLAAIGAAVLLAALVAVTPLAVGIIRAAARRYRLPHAGAGVANPPHHYLARQWPNRNAHHAQRTGWATPPQAQS